ncbi:DUF4864 domain-containing protein [Phyllobacterium sp. LjRoot231]|uniref:DUF4864 domain-containing protein n=1 Tax=Phyllobacterium sp. LjRoot231 TaxID=3342289 RepID=UPI003ECE1B9B
MARAFCLGLAIGSLLLFAVPAISFAEEPVDTAQSIIKQQIEAFLKDDASTAFSFASPAIQEKFLNQSLFFEMVKKAYQPVYRPGNFAFGRSKVAGDEVIQEVLITGADGKDWTAIYQLVKQSDGTYKINGVQIIQSASGPAI